MGAAGRGVSLTMRSRRVVYDDYTNTFMVESRMEALHRQLASRERMTDVRNRSHDTRLRGQKKRVEAEKGIFERKNERESTFHKELLKDHVAHRHVLDDIARTRASAVVRGVSQDAGGNLGHYGVGASKWQLQPLIEQKIKDDSPSARRQRHSAMILNRRRAVFVFDRTKTTSALLRMKIKSRPASDFTPRQTQPTTPAQLVLPPITVRWADRNVADDKGQTSQRTSQKCDTVRDSNKGSGERTSESTMFSTVFVTQERY